MPDGDRDDVRDLDGGELDLSVGSIVGLTALLAGGLIVEGLVLPMFGVACSSKHGLSC